jgi:hypothetical protein
MNRPIEQSVSSLSKDLINDKDTQIIIWSIFIIYNETPKMNFPDTIYLQV